MDRNKVIKLWLDAEEANRKHTEEGEVECMNLKRKFREECKKLSNEDENYVYDYLDDLAA
jgi:hypothetical protein